MLHEFLSAHRERLIERCREKVAKRFEPTDGAGTIDHGVPLFLTQLVETLRDEEHNSFRATDAQPAPAHTAIGRAAAIHGVELLRRGFSVDQVVHDYGDVCQTVTALAVELKIPISTDEFRTLNRCLDNAIADAVVSFAADRQKSSDRLLTSWQQRLEDFGVQHRRLTDIATQSLAAIKTGNIGIGGATGALLAHALEELRALADRTQAEILKGA
jgi:hypothetical protein